MIRLFFISLPVIITIQAFSFPGSPVHDGSSCRHDYLNSVVRSWNFCPRGYVHTMTDFGPPLITSPKEYIPAIHSCDKVLLKAVYSRSQKSAEALARECEASPEIYHDVPNTPGKSIGDLLKRKDIDAVIVCLPILVQPEIIQKSLAAGKHVLSEKPIAKDVNTAEQLIQWCENSSISPLWMVGENLRFIDPIMFGASQLKEIGGELVTFSVNLFTLVDEDNKFYRTEW